MATTPPPAKMNLANRAYQQYYKLGFLILLSYTERISPMYNRFELCIAQNTGNRNKLKAERRIL
ncbi:MAG: hypothetical protein CL912_11590 [Deltaproteobacteria bacterium]|nr:hypothetical protein [Deltaproteobacteria bacterium]